MNALTAEKLNLMISTIRARCDVLDPDKLEQLDRDMAIDFNEHFQFQETQARAHVQQILTTEAAQIVYVALGEVGSAENGGWAKGTDLATKVTITKLMGELLEMRIAGKV